MIEKDRLVDIANRLCEMGMGLQLEELVNMLDSESSMEELEVQVLDCIQETVDELLDAIAAWKILQAEILQAK